MKNTKIEWASSTWSPWRGCTKVSPGCLNCYAEALSHRNPAVMGEWGPGRPRVLNQNWIEPVKWHKQFTKRFGAELSHPRPRIFPSLCDWLDDEVPAEWLAKFLALIRETPNVNWLLLTKRPENFSTRLEAACDWQHDKGDRDVAGWIWDWLKADQVEAKSEGKVSRGDVIPNNVWLGVSVEDPTRAQERIPILLRTPAYVRWISVEPLLGKVELRNTWLQVGQPQMNGSHIPERLDWVVVGGESGPYARACHLQTVKKIVDDCQRHGVAVFVKQLGSKPVGTPAVYNIKHPKGGDPDEWPLDLRIRQYPPQSLEPTNHEA